jgi:hypothetical protein
MATALVSSQAHLLDRYLPEFDFTSSSHTVVNAEAESTRAALARIQPLGSLLAGLDALGLGERVVATLRGDAGTARVAGLVWSFGTDRVDSSVLEDVSAPGHAKLAWSIAAGADGEGRTILSVGVRAGATDDDSRQRLHQSWPIVSSLVESQIRRLVAAVKQAAEETEDSFEWREAEPVRPRLRSVV